MKNSGLVSVIIPTYNASKYIGKTIQSVISQTYVWFEIILVDDCSTDDTLQIVTKLFLKHKIKYKIIKLELNQGVAIARNRGIEVSEGSYIAFLDSDDIWAANKLEKQIRFMDDNNFIFSYTNLYCIDDQDNIIKRNNKIKTVVTYKDLLKRTYISTSSVIIDIRSIGKFSMPNYRRGQDYATWIMLLRNTNSYGMNEKLLKYRVSKSSLSSNKMDNLRQLYIIQTKQEKIYKIKVLYNMIIYTLYGIKKTFLVR